MSTATQARQTPNGQHREAVADPLDQVIAQTQKRQSVVREAATILGVPAEKLCDLLRNVWRTSKDQPPLTDQEMFVGISMIARYELDPIAKEVYVTRGKGGIFTIISVDGWVKVLDRTDHYDGFTVDIHESSPGVIDWVETTIYSKKRSKPTSYRAFASEYSKICGLVAKQIPSHMLRIFSLRHAARLFTPIGGAVLTEEEANYIAREEPAQRQSLNKLDDLTDSLTKPIADSRDDDLPESSYEPESQPHEQGEAASVPDSEDWKAYVQALKCAEGLRDATSVADYWISRLPEAIRPEAQRLLDERRSEIRSTRGERSNRPTQGKLLDSTPTAQAAGV